MKTKLCMCRGARRAKEINRCMSGRRTRAQLRYGRSHIFIAGTYCLRGIGFCACLILRSSHVHALSQACEVWHGRRWGLMPCPCWLCIRVQSAGAGWVAVSSRRRSHDRAATAGGGLAGPRVSQLACHSGVGRRGGQGGVGNKTSRSRHALALAGPTPLNMHLPASPGLRHANARSKAPPPPPDCRLYLVPLTSTKPGPAQPCPGPAQPCPSPCPTPPHPPESWMASSAATTAAASGRSVGSPFQQALMRSHRARGRSAGSGGR